MVTDDSFSALKAELNTFLPSFPVDASQIQILQRPAEFYEILTKKIGSAQSRVFISTLYIGNTENELLWTLRNALHRNHKLKVSILTDGLRGTRGSPGSSTAALLAPLVRDFGPERVEVRMYHTPNLRRFWKWILPARLDEGMGVQHMKLYGVDNEIIISGANLSRDYFTNRQDRYYVFSLSELTHYFYSIHHTICRFSYLLLPGLGSDEEDQYRLKWPSTNLHPTPLHESSDFHTATTNALEPLIGRRNFSTIGKSPQTNKEPDTVIYPITQFSPLLRPNISTEVPTIRLLLYHLSTTLSAAIWLFTSGYFNPTPRLISLLINTHSSGAVLTASPQANGFFNSRGLSGFLPAAYTLLSLRFLQAVGLAGKSPQIGMREWRKGTASEPGGWTYHAKGLWVTTDRECLTVVGSSNYTKRSEELDLEVGVLIATRNEELRRRMGEEQRWLLENGKVVTEEDLKAGERGGGWLVVFLVWVVGLLGMSL